MATATTTNEITFDHDMAMPETNSAVEIVDGILILVPMPTYRHQQTQM